MRRIKIAKKKNAELIIVRFHSHKYSANIDLLVISATGSSLR